MGEVGAERQSRGTVILAFGLLYVFWGSTYLAIRIAVMDIPPVLMTGARFLTAGAVMLLWCLRSGRNISLTLGHAWRLAVVGILLLSLSNGILSWAEQWVPSGLAALIVAITPLWFLMLETWVFPSGYRITRRALAGLILGVAGIVVLLWPELRRTTGLGRRELIGCFSLLGGSFAWAFGSMTSKRWDLPLDPLTAAAYQMFFAGVINVLIGFWLGEWAHSLWSWRSTSAVLYLVIFGSWVGFSSYIWLLGRVPTTKVATYAYVNPMVAVFLGWVVLHERITVFILAGSAIIVVAVALVTGAKLKTRIGESQPALAPVEGPGD
jgi:drug/metabolite transporter (DMT)-like permease